MYTVFTLYVYIIIYNNIIYIYVYVYEVVDRCSSSSWSAACVTMQGWRRTHEDAHILCDLASGTSQASGVFAVLDGHGGSQAAFGGAAILEEALKQLSVQGKTASEVQRVLQELKASGVERRVGLRSGKAI